MFPSSLLLLLRYLCGRDGPVAVVEKMTIEVKAFGVFRKWVEACSSSKMLGKRRVGERMLRAAKSASL